jgi:hypothetical protein
VRSINRRLLPWTAAALLVPATAVLVLRATLPEAAEPVRSASEAPLLPAVWWLRASCWVLFAAGVVIAVLRIGLRFGRRGRIDVDVVLLVYCAVHLAVAFGVGSFDRLPAAPAMAVVLSEGGRLAVSLLGFGFAGLGVRRAAPPR